MLNNHTQTCGQKKNYLYVFIAPTPEGIVTPPLAFLRSSFFSFFLF